MKAKKPRFGGGRGEGLIGVPELACRVVWKDVRGDLTLTMRLEPLQGSCRSLFC